VFVVCNAGSGLCYDLTHSKDSYRLCVFVCVCVFLCVCVCVCLIVCDINLNNVAAA